MSYRRYSFASLGSIFALAAGACSLANLPSEPISGEPSTSTSNSVGTGGSGGSTTSKGGGGAVAAGGQGGAAPVCGDGDVSGDEACDDGNSMAGDGCAMCSVEAGYTCEGMPSTCTTVCGDGVIAGDEACDDQGTQAGDGCDADCKVETGYTCMGEPSSCEPICGDGVLLSGEACDDGGTQDGDGCSKSCTLEVGWDCENVANMPTSCTRLFPVISEVNVGTPDYVTIANPHTVDINLGGIGMMWNHSQVAVQQWVLPEKILGAGKEYVMSETAGSPVSFAVKPAGVSSFGASAINGGWVSLCDGACSASNGQNVKDFMHYEGTGLAPKFPSSVSFSGGAVDGIDNSTIHTATAYRRVGLAGSGLAFTQNDWAWGCGAYGSCLIADSFEPKTGGLAGWGTPSNSYSVANSTTSYHGSRSAYLSGGPKSNYANGFVKSLPVNSQPTNFRVYVRPGTTGASAHAYVMLSGTTSGSLQTTTSVYVYAVAGNFVALASNQSKVIGQYAANNWYRVDITKINYISKSYNISIALANSDGSFTSIGSSSVAFKNSNVTQTRRAVLQNYDLAYARWDKVSLF